MSPAEDDLNIDTAMLQRFEDGLDPVRPEAGPIPARILAYGEISAVLQLPFQPGVVFKRMGGFPSAEAIAAHRQAVEEYIAKLREIGLTVPPTAIVTLKNRHGEHVFYVAQQEASRDAIGNAVLAAADDAGFARALEAVLGEMAKVWRYNRENTEGVEAGLDCQISNWMIEAQPDGSLAVGYFDVATPLLRRNGQETMDVRMLIKSLPLPLRWTIETLFLDEVVERYYDLHQVLNDIAGNFHKEGFPERIDRAIALMNRYFSETAPGLLERPVLRKEVDAYYTRDKWIWILFLEFRKWHRALYTKVLRRRYPFILPGAIRR